METEDCLDQNQDFQHNYDDDHDSDVEARLYAEVYHSNTIIGEENNTNNSTSQNQYTDVLSDLSKSNSNNHDLLHGKNTSKPNNNGNIACDSNVALSDDSINNVINTKNTTKQSKLQNTNNLSKESVSTRRMNNLSNTNNSTKRISHNCLDEINKFSKKKKLENHCGMKETQSSQFNGPLSDSQPNKQVDNSLQCNNTSLINPYSKDVMGNRQTGIKLLSPEFRNLFFAGKTRKKKKKDYPIKQDKSKKANICNGIPNTDITLQPSNIKPVENNHEKDLSPMSAVIDISSESSNESFEDDSKYNTIVTTDKKLKKRESGLKDTSTHDLSDSEESIFEVPVPPKPAPPVIEVKDSDNEHENSNESDKDSFLSHSFNSQETVVQNDHEISLDSSMNKTLDTCEIISDSDDSNSLILNCTEIQKGVSSLSEIKKMNQQTLSPNQKNSSISNLNKIQHSQKTPELFNSPVITGKSPTSSKSKQISMSSSKNINKNISGEEYFFQPMTEKMTTFYNNSWGGEDFDMDKVKSNMSNDPNKWAILNRDLVLTGPRKKRYFGMTCARCHKDGHRQNECPEPNKGPTCHMCGANGHFATYCPHTKCLTCGRKQTMYRTSCGHCEKLFCARCRSQGHKEDSCPDLWRRYHHTTNSAAPKIPRNVKNVMKSKYELFCCNCTKQGHDSLACRKLRWSQHFPSPSFVTHYNGPIYNDVTNFDAALIADDVQEHSCNVYNTHNNLSSCNYISSNSVSSKTVTTNFPRSERRNESIVQNRLDCLSNISDPNKNVIFNVSGMKTKYNQETQSMKSVTLKLNVTDKSNPNSVESWKKLSDFLKGLLFDMSAVFRLERKDKQLLMYVKSSRKYIDCLSTLIKQYASRSNFERSQMLLSGERTLKVIVGHLSQKFAEMKNLNEDILRLHEETKRLHEELDKESQIQNEIHSRLKLNELVLSEKKLLMLLYREGFGDESLGQLRKLFLKMERLMEQGLDKSKTKKKSKFGREPLISYKFLFTYLYYYNNVFVPYESKKLDNYIQNYKDNLDKRNKLLNCPLLFPEKTNEKQDDPNEVAIEDSTSNEKVSENSSKSLPSTSQKLPMLQNAITEVNDNSKSSSSESPKQPLVTSKQKSKKKLNCLYLHAIQAKNPTRKDNLMQNFRNFLKNARNCLEKASKLNSPRLRDDIVNLQRDLEDEIHVSTNKVRKFKKKLREETLRLQGITAPNSYEKFCASL